MKKKNVTLRGKSCSCSVLFYKFQAPGPLLPSQTEPLCCLCGNNCTSKVFFFSFKKSVLIKAFSDGDRPKPPYTLSSSFK